MDESLDKNSQEGKSCKVAGSCLLVAVYLSYILLYNLPVHSRTEIDMAVF